MLKTIVLIGMMGSGKTSVGKELAKNLNLNFIDSDQEIEKKCKISIPSIFEKKGEDYFRKIEEKICCKLIDGKPKILSLGGGAFINFKIRKEIKKNGVSFWISTNLENIYDRLLQSKNSATRLSSDSNVYLSLTQNLPRAVTRPTRADAAAAPMGRLGLGLMKVCSFLETRCSMQSAYNACARNTLLAGLRSTSHLNGTGCQGDSVS